MDLLDLAQGYPFLNIKIDNNAKVINPSIEDFKHIKNIEFVERNDLFKEKDQNIKVLVFNSLSKNEFFKLKEDNPFSFILSSQFDREIQDQVGKINWDDLNEIRSQFADIDEISFDFKLAEYQVEWMNMLLRMNKEAKDYLVKIRKEILDCFHVDQLSEDSQEVLTFFRELAELRLQAFACSDNKDFFKVINGFIKKNGYIEEIGLNTKKDLYKELSSNGLNYYYVPIPRDEDFIFIRYSLNAKKGAFKYVILTVLINLIDTFLYRDQLKFEAKNESMLIDLVFKSFPLAMALITEKGELLAHNKNFDKLEILPNQLLAVNSKGQISLGSQDFIVDKIQLKNQSEIHNEVNLFILSSLQTTLLGLSEQKINSLSNEQLGIISSSIAHELKNPIAGVLAAIDYLKLDDTLATETLNDLSSMQSSLARCRELIDIFLGFSRAQTNHVSGLSPEQSLEKALTLMKFRMVESHCMIEVVKKSKDGEFSKVLNSSVLIMIFYLSLNEALTEFSHLKLISNDLQKQASLKIELFEKHDSLELKFVNLKGQLNRIDQSKLLQHLSDFAGVSLESEGNKIKISEWKLKS